MLQLLLRSWFCGLHQSRLFVLEKVMENKQQANSDGHFLLPVDSEHKAITIRLFSLAQPHMAAFHISWVSFMTVFFSTFAPATLMPAIREDIGATRTDIGNAGIAAVVGAVGSRILVGMILDTWGPRFGFSAVLLLTAPAVFGLALTETVRDFICLRFFVGLSLSAFVCCEFWCSSMFGTRILGTANAIAAGWGNLGVGLCHIVLPLAAYAAEKHVPSFQAWRWTMFLPGTMHIICGAVVILCGQDLPDGDYRTLREHGQMHKAKPWSNFKCATMNPATWIMLLSYGYCFGVELTVDNYLASYLFDQFVVPTFEADMWASIFGSMNLFTRATGGLASDFAAHYYGMRGRLWVHWTIQTLAGVFCILLGLASESFTLTLVMLVMFSFFCQAACGTSYGIVPFISARSGGLVSGYVGAGGNFGAAFTQAVFFTLYPFQMHEAFKWMGILIVCITAIMFLIYFPMWGGMLFPPQSEFTEEDYYMAEFTADEVAQGLSARSLRFAAESRSQRCQPRQTSTKAGKHSTTTTTAAAR